MVTSSGLRLAGEYEDSLGSLLFFLLQQQQRSNSAGGAAPAEQPLPKPSQEGAADLAIAAGAGSLPQQGGSGQFSLGAMVIKWIENKLAPSHCPID